MDDKGDACDFCPDTPNPITACGAPPATEARIQDVQSGAIGVGSAVLFKNVVVTAVGSADMMVQDPNPMGGTAANSGVRIFVAGGGPSGAITVGSVVDIEGIVDEFFDDTEIEAQSVNFVSAGTPIAATPVTLAEAASEEYEGVLVTITDGAVSDTAFDCGVTPPCADTDLWEVGGASGVVVFDRYYEDGDFTNHVGDESR